MKISQAQLYFSGMVQGVGFRMTCHMHARDLKLNGWVKNLPDGRVEAVVEGSQKNIQQLIDELKSHFGSYIRDVDVKYRDSAPSFNNFSIRH